MINKELIKKIIVTTFVSIPFLSSLISTVHLVDLFALGNQSWMAIVLSIAFELGSIASLLILAILDKINKSMVMSIFVVLIMLQIIGNIYFSFDYLNQHLKLDPNFLGSFQELISYFVSGDITLMKLIVSCLVSIPVPLISLFFLKSMIDYLQFDDKQVEKIVENEIVNETGNDLNIYDNKIDDVPDIKTPNLPQLEIINDRDDVSVNATVYEK